ncbi:MAG: hypothetical protein ABFD11_08460 [Christensenella sp.]
MKQLSRILVLLLVLVIPAAALAETSDTPLPETPTPTVAATTPAPVTPTPVLIAAAEESTSSGTSDPLTIDSENLYPGMDKTYAQGYVPTVASGKVTIVLPLRGTTFSYQVNMVVDLGSTTDNPFQYGNYSQTVQGTGNVYVFTLEIPLSADRYNGTYPVLLKTDYLNTSGDYVEQKFTVYVTITDGKTKDTSTDSGSSSSSSYVPSADAPELYVESCVITPNCVGGDETFTVHVVVKNIGNKTAYASKLIYGCEETDITSIDSNGAILLETLKKGETVEAYFKMKTDRDALAGNRQFFITLSFSARTGGVYNITRSFVVNVVQPSRIAFDPVSLPKEITAGETVTLPANVYNTGRSILRNVTVSLEGAGLFPSSSVFLGDIDPGEGKTGEMKVFVGMLSMTEGYTDNYGKTTGIYTVSYQDSTGENNTETLELKTEKKQPVISPSPTPDPTLQQAQSQWWITALVGFAIIAVIVAATVVSKFARELRMRN